MPKHSALRLVAWIKFHRDNLGHTVTVLSVKEQRATCDCGDSYTNGYFTDGRRTQ